jgi:hypothetical protein
VAAFCANRSFLKESHFGGVEEEFYLNSEGFRKFVGLYHDHMKTGEWNMRFKNQSDNLKKAMMSNEPYHHTSNNA